MADPGRFPVAGSGHRRPPGVPRRRTRLRAAKDRRRNPGCAETDTATAVIVERINGAFEVRVPAIGDLSRVAVAFCYDQGDLPRRNVDDSPRFLGDRDGGRQFFVELRCYRSKLRAGLGVRAHGEKRAERSLLIHRTDGERETA